MELEGVNVDVHVGVDVDRVKKNEQASLRFCFFVFTLVSGQANQNIIDACRSVD